MSEEIKNTGSTEAAPAPKKKKSRFEFAADVPILDPAAMENLVFNEIPTAADIPSAPIAESVAPAPAAETKNTPVTAKLPAIEPPVTDEEIEVAVSPNRHSLEDFMKKFDLPDGKPMNIALNSLVHEEFKNVAIENQTTITSLVNTVLHHWLIQHSAEIKAVRKLRGKKRGII